MWIVAVAWVYVVGLVALTEASVVAGIMTFLGYCVLPLSILFYLTGGKARRARAAARESRTSTNDTSSDNSSTSDSSSDSSSNDDSTSDSSSDSSSSSDD
jgi:nucleosome binding factor SPN SPT16 subunit